MTTCAICGKGLISGLVVDAECLAELQERLAKAEAERDAAIADIIVAQEEGRCIVCAHYKPNGAPKSQNCEKWPSRKCWQWRGIPKEGQ